MQMRGPPRMPPHRRQHLADGTVVRYGVRRCHNRFEVETAIGEASKPSASLRMIQLCALNIVIALVVRLPYRYVCASNTLAIVTFHGTTYETPLTMGTVRDVISIVEPGRIVHEKGAKNR